MSKQNRIKELQHYSIHSSNAWLGSYGLQENLYMEELQNTKCDTNNICEALYFALLYKSEFNDMRECDISMKLEIKSQQETMAYYDDEDFVKKKASCAQKQYLACDD